MVTTADDTRMWLTNEGVPMLIYFSSMPNHCRGMSIIDARAVVPGLDEMMRWAGFNEPIRYSEPFRLIRAGQGEIEACCMLGCQMMTVLAERDCRKIGLLSIMSTANSLFTPGSHRHRS